jgi:hypothetical protein
VGTARPTTDFWQPAFFIFSIRSGMAGSEEGSAQHQQPLLADVAQQFQDRETAQPRHHAQQDHDEQGRARIESARRRHGHYPRSPGVGFLRYRQYENTRSKVPLFRVR